MQTIRSAGLALLLLAVMLGALALGFWQLQRAEEKRALLRLVAEAQARSITTLTELDATPGSGRLVQLQGRFGREVMLLDNRILAGQAGVEVHQPFLDRLSGLEVLINRGWMPLPPDRSLPEEVAWPAGELRLRARIHISPGRQLVWRADEFSGDWPWLVQALDPELAAEALGRPLFGQLLRLEPSAPGALPRHWPAVNLGPAVHTGYAVQWFALAAVSLLMSGLLLYRQYRQYRHRHGDKRKRGEA